MRKKGNQIGNIVHESVPVSNTEVRRRPLRRLLARDRTRR